MAPSQGRSPVHVFAKRQLPHTTFIGIAVAVGVFLIILISIALWCYVRGWRRLQIGTKLESENRSIPPTKIGHSHRASKYWSADDIGTRPTKVQVTEVTDKDSIRESRIVVLPSPTVKEFGEKDRESKVVKLPPPSLRSWRSDTRDRLLPQRPSSKRVAVLSRHVSMQFKDISMASPATPDRTPVLDDFPRPGQQWSKVTDLDWQEYQR